MAAQLIHSDSGQLTEVKPQIQPPSGDYNQTNHLMYSISPWGSPHLLAKPCLQNLFGGGQSSWEWCSIEREHHQKGEEPSSWSHWVGLLKERTYNIPCLRILVSQVNIIRKRQYFYERPSNNLIPNNIGLQRQQPAPWIGPTSKLATNTAPTRHVCKTRLAENQWGLMHFDPIKVSGQFSRVAPCTVYYGS